MSGIMVALGRCLVHGGLFEFHPDLVASVLIDPVTGQPPDVGPGGDVSRSVRQPVCPPCAKTVNAAKRHRGIGPPYLDERDSLDMAAEMSR